MNQPELHPSVYVAAGAQIVGDVTIGADASVWYHAVIRGDEDRVVIGPRSNVQDGCILHEDHGTPLLIGKGVTVGHGAIVHGCTIGDNTLVGMGAILLNGCRIGRNVLIAAGSLVTQNTVIPDGVMVMGSPAKVKRPLTEEELASLEESAQDYVNLSRSAMGETP